MTPPTYTIGDMVRAYIGASMWASIIIYFWLDAEIAMWTGVGLHVLALFVKLIWNSDKTEPSEERNV